MANESSWRAECRGPAAGPPGVQSAEGLQRARLRVKPVRALTRL